MNLDHFALSHICDNCPVRVKYYRADNSSSLCYFCCQELERRLGEHKHDSHFVSMVKSRVVNWEEMERQNRLLSEENKTLR